VNPNNRVLSELRLRKDRQSIGPVSGQSSSIDFRPRKQARSDNFFDGLMIIEKSPGRSESPHFNALINVSPPKSIDSKTVP